MREFYRELVVARQRRDDEHDRDVTQAWNTVRLWATTRSKNRLPALEKQFLNGRRRPGQAQTVKQQRQALEMLSQQFGIPLRKARKPEAHGVQ